MTDRDLSASAPVLATISALRPSLRAGQRAVCAVIERDPATAVEATAGEIAVAAGVSAATVVRTAQALGYSGFPQLRVMLARDLGAAASRPQAGGAAGAVLDYFAAVGEAVPDMTSLLDPGEVDQAVKRLAAARHVFVCGNGVSAPVALDLAMRLNSLGRFATTSNDTLDQRIRARLLTPNDVCVVVSGTGATETSMAVARGARQAGATVIAFTSFSDTALAQVADINLVVVMGTPRMAEELHHQVRLPHLILVNALVTAVALIRPKTTRVARSKAIEAVSEILLEP